VKVTFGAPGLMSDLSYIMYIAFIAEDIQCIRYEKE